VSKPKTKAGDEDKRFGAGNNGSNFTPNAKVRHRKVVEKGMAKAKELEEAGQDPGVWGQTHMLLTKNGEINLTPEAKEIRKALYLEGLIDFGTPTAGARTAGISIFTVYKWKRDDPEFKQMCEEAEEIITQGLEEEAIVRAKEKSDLLLMFLLKKRRPEYRDNWKEPEEGRKKAGEEEMSAARRLVEDKLQKLRERAETQEETKISIKDARRPKLKPGKASGEAD
jgi:hypothetical protein